MRTLSSRRQFLGSAGAVATCLVAGPAVAATAGAASRDAASLVSLARAELGRLGAAIPHDDWVGIADFARPSSEPRFHLIEMKIGAVTDYLVAHGRGSDPRHSGRLARFSNEVGSYATSAGAYCTGDYYIGKYGRSMRLRGLEASNDNAERRAIVVHGAWYVSPRMIHMQGFLGRSEGCFAFAPGSIGAILDRLGPGRLLLATKL